MSIQGNPANFRNSMPSVNQQISERAPKTLNIIHQQLADNIAHVKDQLDGSLSNPGVALAAKSQVLDTTGNPATVDVGEDIGSIVGAVFFTAAGIIGGAPTSLAVNGSTLSQIDITGSYTATKMVVYYIPA